MKQIESLRRGLLSHGFESIFSVSKADSDKFESPLLSRNRENNLYFVANSLN